MSAVTAGRHIALSRVDEAYRRLSHHSLVECVRCKAFPPKPCEESTALLLAWSRARRAARR